MSGYANIPHPLFNLPASSQRDRLTKALDPTLLEIDGRSLADLIDFIYHFAGQVNHYDENMDLSDWRAFFADSLPFLVARIHKWDVDGLEENLKELNDLVDKQPGTESLQSLVSFIFNELILPIAEWQRRLEEVESGFNLMISGLIAGNLQNPLKDFISLVNGAGNWYCTTKPDYSILQQQQPWGIELIDLFVVDNSFHNTPGGSGARITVLKNQLIPIAERFLEAMREIKRKAPAYMRESLEPLREEYQKRHAPHLGLLFTFLLLFERFKTDLNKLSTRHLEFFYDKVLGIKSRPLVPDQAHLVFETQKHIEEKLLKEGLLFKNGKDAAGNDIVFKLDSDLVVDKSQVESLRTLYLNHHRGYVRCDQNEKKRESFVEGLYIAPAANKADGLEQPFKKEGSSWSTLGNKYSKFFLPPPPQATEAELYPPARLGFVLSSPVLLLNEGERKIEIFLCLKYEDLPCIEVPELRLPQLAAALQKEYYQVDDDSIKKALEDGLTENGSNYLQSLQKICNPYALSTQFENDQGDPIQEVDLPAADRTLIDKYFTKTQALRVAFSGKEEWLPVEAGDMEITFGLPVSSPADDFCQDGDYELKIEVNLPDDFPAVTFYDSKALGETLNTQLPTVRIELDPCVSVGCDTVDCIPDCDLERCAEGKAERVSLYHYLRHMTICDSCILVEVCGVRNLIVQNEENVQDINGLVAPFGVRPKVDAEFYIGSKEIFCKNWKQFRVNAVWKDKPADLGDYYTSSYSIFEMTPLLESAFQFLPAVLQDRVWEYFDAGSNPELFSNLVIPAAENMLCDQEWTDEQHDSLDTSDYYEFKRSDFSGLPTYEPGQLTPAPLQPYDVNTRKGFIKMLLKNQDFLHDIYPTELARAMIKLSGGVDPNDVEALFANIRRVEDIRAELATKISAINSHIGFLVTELQNAVVTLNNAVVPLGIIQQLNNLQTSLQTVLTDLQPINTPSAATARTNAINALNTILASPTGPLAVIITEAGNLLGDLTHSLNTHALAIQNLLNMVEVVIPPPFPFPPPPPNYPLRGVNQLMNDLLLASAALVDFADDYNDVETIPNQPYDPLIKYLSLDYCAKADQTDIQLTHLYPFENTQKAEDITLNPPLLPVFTHEGTLFIGLKNLTPGSNLHLLFQLAEATADSETNAARIEWEYLRRNEWLELREGFHILEDGTDGLTRSGIVRIAIPPDINKDASNTIMPAGLHWIKASAWNNTQAVSETIGVHTQAARVTYFPSAANERSEMLLTKGSISKLVEADSSLKGIDQVYESFGGRPAEVSNNYYQRVSERLRHKGRGVDKYDYERLVLDHFPEIYRVRCINHAFSLSARDYRRDLELAPGFVGLAVIPDILQLKTDARFAPQAPVSLLNKIRDQIRKKISPFVRLKVMNPRYELIHIEGSVILKEGKPVTFFNNKLKEDLRLFLAPWASGDQEALNFGRSISKSEVIRFVENLDYVDYICYLCLKHEETEKRCYFPDPVASTLDLRLRPSRPIVCEGSPIRFDTGLPKGSQANPVRYFIQPDVGNAFQIVNSADPRDTQLNLPEDLPSGIRLPVGRYTVRLEELLPGSTTYTPISTARMTVVKDEEVIVPRTARSILTGGEMRIQAERWRCPEYSDDPLCRGRLKKFPAGCREPEKKVTNGEGEVDHQVPPIL